MIRRLLLTLSLVAAPLAAQDPADAEPDEPAKESWVRSNASWGKFVTLGASGLMFTFAVINNNKAGDSFVTLETRCVLSQSLCEIDDNGEYINDVSESLFQETIDHDQAARAWLIGAQVALHAVPCGSANGSQQNRIGRPGTGPGFRWQVERAHRQAEAR